MGGGGVYFTLTKRWVGVGAKSVSHAEGGGGGTKGLR